MKILYSVQATGNGHISRAHQLYPYFAEMGEVDIMLSGSNATLPMQIPVKYKSIGMSLFYSKCGGLDYRKIWNNFNYSKIMKDVKDLPVEKYDIIINDFDYVTAKACQQKKVSSVQFGHQGSFMSDKTPRPPSKSLIGELILKKYAPATHYVGLHFDRYDEFIFPPVIKDEFIHATPEDHGHITVYLPAYEQDCIKKVLLSAAPREVHWFVPDIKDSYKEDNITYFPVNQKDFNESLIYCHGLVTGGGFETPAEALYLGKKLIAIPIDGQYEQQCNATAAEKLGVLKMKFLDQGTNAQFLDWIEAPQKNQKVIANNIHETLAYIMTKSR